MAPSAAEDQEPETPSPSAPSSATEPGGGPGTSQKAPPPPRGPRMDPRERAQRMLLLEATSFVNKFVLIPSLAAGSLLWFTRDWSATAFIGLLLFADLIRYLPSLAGANPGIPAISDHARTFTRSLLLILCVADHLYGPAADAPGYLTFIGIGLVAFGIFVQRLAAKAFFQAENPVFVTEQAHTLMTGGIFRYLRHPTYAGMWLISVGAALLLRSLLGAALIAVVIGALLLIRVKGEEERLVETFGDEYRQYMKRTKRFIPGVI